MIQLTIDESVLQKYIETAKRTARTEDQEEYFDPQDWSGGNFDDCFEMGQDEGTIWATRALLDDLGVKY
jgi:hypothetical protein